MTSTGASGLENAVERLHLNPSEPLPVRQNHRARNITEQFNNASKALETGQLVRDESFRLFDSVQALEIMDPKMDTGFLEPGETLEETYDVCQDLSPGQVLWIMDELLCYEMAWHQGYPLAQNLLTSVYIYNLLVQERLSSTAPFFRPLDGSQREPGSLVQRVLRPFCIGIIKTCDVVIEMIQMQQYYEEEDLNTHTFGLDLLTDVSDEEYFQLSWDAVSWISEQDHKESISTGMCAALASRLSCRQYFLSLILPHSDKFTPEIDEDTFRILTKGIIEPICDKWRESVEGSFSTKFQRKLASTVPPRPIVKLPLEEAVHDLIKMFEDVREALKADMFGRQTTILNLTTFLWAFAFREPSPFARAVVQMLLFNDGKVAGPGEGIKGLLIEDLRSLLYDRACLKENFWDVEVPTDPRHQIARAVDFFLEQAPQEFINVLRCLCQNRCRIRRCLTNVVRDVDTLQNDLLDYFGGDPTKESGSSFPALIKHTLILMTQRIEVDAIEWAIQLGFEQDIYQPFEIPYLQGYMAKVSKWKRTSMECFAAQIKSCRTEVMVVAGLTQLLCRVPRKYHEKEEDIWEGLSLLHIALARIGAVGPPQTPYTTIRALMQQRMEPFLALNHGIPTTDPGIDFDFASFPSLPLAELLFKCTARLDTARKIATAWYKEVQAGEPWEDNFEHGVSAKVSEYLKNKIMMTLKAAVKAAVAVDALKRALKDADGDEEKLYGRVGVAYERPQTGSYWAVPQVEVSKSS